MVNVVGVGIAAKLVVDPVAGCPRGHGATGDGRYGHDCGRAASAGNGTDRADERTTQAVATIEARPLGLRSSISAGSS